MVYSEQINARPLQNLCFGKGLFIKSSPHIVYLKLVDAFTQGTGSQFVHMGPR